ncbi:MAG: hypothetical protein ACRDLL_09770 [Solirubrobacterales bacterium]
MRTAHGALALLTGIAALGAVAYAAVPREPARPAPNQERGAGVGSVPRPSIVQHPDKVATTASARFGFAARGRDPRFLCRLDGRAWKRCRSPIAFNGLAAGIHSFSVRSASPNGRRSRPALFRWRVLEPMGFSIQPRLDGLSALYPGAPAVPLPLTIANPNPVPIFITSLRATATADPLDCTSAENLVLADSSASPATPIAVPAGGSVSLPAPGASAPTIQLRDLPVNQDACQNARFPLSFTGEARG